MKKLEAGDRARVKFRLVEFETEGGSAALQEGVRQLVTALTARSAPAPRALPRPVEPAGRASDGPVNGELFPVEAPEEADAAIDVTPEPPTEPKPRQPRKTPTFKVINGLNLEAGEGYPSLQEFARQKNADNHHARYLVAAVWLKRYGGIKEFTADHAFTIYKVLGWGSPPNDAGQPLRELKKRDLLSADKPGFFVVNDAGEARVERMGGSPDR